MPRVGRVDAEGRAHDVRGGSALERRLAGEQLIDERTGGEDVRARVDRLGAHLLRRHVADGADDGMARRRHGDGVRREWCGRFRDAEIEHLDAPFASHHDVVGLDVAMRDADRMRGRQRIGDLRADLRHFPNGDAQAAQRRPLYELGDEIGDPVVGADVEERKDIGMIESGDVARFLFEPGEARGISGQVWRQDFQRDLAPEARVARAVDGAHASRPERRDRSTRRDGCRRQSSST